MVRTTILKIDDASSILATPNSIFLSGGWHERLKAANLKFAVGASTTNRGFESLSARLNHKCTPWDTVFVKFYITKIKLVIQEYLQLYIRNEVTKWLS